MDKHPLETLRAQRKITYVSCDYIAGVVLTSESRVMSCEQIPCDDPFVKLPKARWVCVT